MLQPGHPHPDPQQHLEGLLSPAALPLQQELLELFDTAAVCCVFEEQHELSLALVISIAFCVHLQAIVCVGGVWGVRCLVSPCLASILMRRKSPTKSAPGHLFLLYSLHRWVQVCHRLAPPSERQRPWLFPGKLITLVLAFPMRKLEPPRPGAGPAGLTHLPDRDTAAAVSDRAPDRAEIIVWSEISVSSGLVHDRSSN